MICQWQLGLLTMRTCGLPAAGGCAMCGRMLCPAHTSMGQNGPACPQCASTHDGYADTEDTEIAEARNEYYTPYGGAAQFGSSGYFSGADAGAMGTHGLPLPRKLRKEDADDAMET